MYVCVCVLASIYLLFFQPSRKNQISHTVKQIVIIITYHQLCDVWLNTRTTDVSEKCKIHSILIKLYRNQSASILICRSIVLSCRSNHKNVQLINEKKVYGISFRLSVYNVDRMRVHVRMYMCTCVCSDLFGTINASFGTGFSVRLCLWTYSFCFHINKSALGWNITSNLVWILQYQFNVLSTHFHFN